ncbi:unnamed protein product, partial [Brassica napus]
MVDSSIQSEPGDLDDDSTTEAQPQIDGTGSESSQSLVTIKAVTASPISSSPAAKDGDEEAPSTVTHVLMTSSPALAPAETNTALVSSGEPPPSRAGSLEHGVTDSVYEVNTLVSVGIEPASPTATNPPPPISTSQQKEVVAHGAPTTTLQENTAQPPPIQFDVPPEPVNWPPLSAKSVGKKVSGNEIAGNSSSNAIPPPTKAIPTDKKRFPWTARLNPKSRNLHRVTIPDSCQVDSFVKSVAVEVDFSPVVSGFNTTIVSSSPTIDMSSLASITLLENMCTSPSIICINDTIETPTQEPAQHHSATTTSPEIYTSTSNGACLDEPDLGSNKFASLLNVEEDEEDILEFDNDSEPMDYMSPFGKRILRERPVKPTTKAKEMHSQSTSRGRGSRGRSRGRGSRG